MSVKNRKKARAKAQQRQEAQGGQREEGDATLGDAIRSTGADRPRVPRPGQPPERGLKEDEPLWTRPSGADRREGVRREGSFRHVEKDGPAQFEEEEE